jgi:Mn-containing catalase
MFYHAKELQFNARVSAPDPTFARLLLEQFGGGNGELKAAMQYFVQAFAARQPYPDKYDLLMDVATEELSHLEIVGATITMLLEGINGELKDAAERADITSVMNGKANKEQFIHEALMNPHFLVLSGGGPVVTDSQGSPWQGSYVNAIGDLSVDLRSDIAAESRAKIVYEYLMQFTDDEYVKETLRFLMTREISHFQMFSAALATVEPNFPPGVLQGDPRFMHTYFNMSDGASVRGPWNEGQGPWPRGEQWNYVENPQDFVVDTKGQTDLPSGMAYRAAAEVERIDKQVSDFKSREVREATPTGEAQWSSYPQDTLRTPKGITEELKPTEHH